jgi:hypothetical protein
LICVHEILEIDELARIRAGWFRLRKSACLATGTEQPSALRSKLRLAGLLLALLTLSVLLFIVLRYVGHAIPQR